MARRARIILRNRGQEHLISQCILLQ